MDVYPRWIFFFLFHLCHCENMRELLRKRRSASALNNPQYQIIPRVQRMNYWQDDSYEDFDSYEDALGWLDGDFGMRSSAYKHKYSVDDYSSIRRSESDQDNEILGSGNFLIIKGGTFYGTERSYLHKNYGYPKNYGNYYGGNQFQNFRDFADLKKQKGDRRRFF